MKRVGVVCVAFLLPALAIAYQRSIGAAPENKALFWTTPTVAVVLNPNGPSVPGSGCGDVAALVSSSLEEWTQPCSALRFQFAGVDTNAEIVGYFQDGSDKNLIVFRKELCERVVPAADVCRVGDPDDPEDDGPDTVDCANKYGCWQHGLSRTIAITTTSYQRETGVILDADTELHDWNGSDAGYKFTCTSGSACRGDPDGSCVGTDLASIVTHEAGHMIGLDHPPATNATADATMLATYTPGTIALRDLAQDDINGVCAIYPKATQNGGSSSDGGGCSTATAGVISMLGVAVALGSRRRRRQDTITPA